MKNNLAEISFTFTLIEMEFPMVFSRTVINFSGWSLELLSLGIYLNVHASLYIAKETNREMLIGESMIAKKYLDITKGFGDQRFASDVLHSLVGIFDCTFKFWKENKLYNINKFLELLKSTFELWNTVFYGDILERFFVQRSITKMKL